MNIADLKRGLIALNVTEGISLTDVSDYVLNTMKVVRTDANGDEIDYLGNVRSGTPVYATVAAAESAVPAATHENFVCIITGVGKYGTLYRVVNSVYMPMHAFELSTQGGVSYNITFPANVTYTVADNGSGKCRIGGTNGLSAANDNAYVYLISHAGTTWVDGTKHRITWVSSSAFDLPDLDYVGGMGAPVFADASGSYFVAEDFTIPDMFDNSRLKFNALTQLPLTAATTRDIIWTLGSTDYYNNNQKAGTNKFCKTMCEIINQNSTSLQTAAFMSNTSYGLGNSSAGTVSTGTEDTSSGSSLKLRINNTTAGENIGVIQTSVEYHP